jgi:hypothetical protein
VPARTFREIVQLTLNDPRYGLTAIGVFLLMVLFGMDGAVLPWLWADLVDGAGSMVWPVVGIAAALLVLVPAPYLAARLFPEWWVRQMLRIRPDPGGSVLTPQPRWLPRPATRNGS